MAELSVNNIISKVEGLARDINERLSDDERNLLTDIIDNLNGIKGQLPKASDQINK